MRLRLGRVRTATHVVVGMLLVTGIAFVGVPPASAAGGFVIVSSANPPSVFDSQLASVSCPDATTCFAVGSYELRGSSDGKRTLVERRNGATWSRVPSANLPSANNELRSISCVSATSCFAIGQASPLNLNGTVQVLIERWNGVAWSMMAGPSQLPQDAGLAGISCVGPSNCFAVGNGGRGVPRTLVEHWNGTSWSVVPSPNGSSDGANFLKAVSCTSSSSCFAVGLFQDETLHTAKTFTIRWNGTKWSRVGSPNSARSTWNEFSGVSCLSVRLCYAVGDTQRTSGDLGASYTLAEKWNGTKWSIMLTPNPKTPNRASLANISCASATSCFAVGYSVKETFRDTFGPHTLFEQFANGGWTIQPSANAPGGGRSELFGVSCKFTTSCSAVGFDQPAGGELAALIETNS
jgi:hypothetical protein